MRNQTNHQANRRSPRGTSLIEVLISLFILALLMVGVLQLFSLSLLTNLGSASRTEMTFKAQQVVENLRMANVIFQSTRATGNPIPGIGQFPLAAGTYNIPYYSGDTGGVNTATWAYWGPAGANVMETENGPYKIAYTIQNGGTVWSVTVVATASSTGTRKYIGSGISNKRIEYVSQISQ